MQDYNSAINICGVYDVRFHRGLFYIRCCPKGKLQEGVKGWKKLFFFFKFQMQDTLYIPGDISKMSVSEYAKRCICGYIEKNYHVST